MIAVEFLFSDHSMSEASFTRMVNERIAQKGKAIADIKPFVHNGCLSVMISYEKEDLKVCPICGGSLTAVPSKPGIWVCDNCGQMFGGIPTAPVKGDEE